MIQIKKIPYFQGRGVQAQLPLEHLVDVHLPLLRGRRRAAAPQGIQLPLAKAAHPLQAGLPGPGLGQEGRQAEEVSC